MASKIFHFPSKTIISQSNTKRLYLWKTLIFATAATATVGAFSLVEPNPHQKQKQTTRQHGTVRLSKPILTNPAPLVPSSSSLSSRIRNIALLLPSPSNTVLCASAETQEVNHNHNHNHNGNFFGGDPTTYYYEKMQDPPPNFAENHAILGALLKPGYIERYNAYRRVPVLSSAQEIVGIDTVSKEVCVADIRIGEKLNGHTGIVHGGIISLMLDDTFGWGYQAMGLSQGKSFGDEDFPIVVTANLTVNYRSPLPAGSDVVIRVRHEKTEGRKIYVSARMESHDGSVLYSEATALFITVKKQHFQN
jgi:acyl-coenzyme A thioesterase PaaI-like protein